AVQGQVVGAEREVDVVAVGPPLDAVAEDPHVEVLAALQVPDLEGDVPDAERRRGGLGGHAGILANCYNLTSVATNTISRLAYCDSLFSFRRRRTRAVM